MRTDELDIAQTGPRAVPPLSWRERQRHGDSGGNRRLALIAAAIGGGVVVALGLMLLGGHSGGGVPMVAAPTAPLRTAPKNPGGIHPVGMDEDLSSGPLSGDKLAPPPETPNLAALQAQSAPAAAAAGAAQPSVAPPIAAPAVPAPPVAPPARRAEHAVAPPRHIARVPEHPAPALRQPEHARTEHVPPGHVQVQLAALGSEAAAQAEWRLLSHRLPGLLGQRRPDYQRVVARGHVFWRLRLSGFRDSRDAAAFCADLRRHRAACDVAGF